jgi:hypothetical protein
MDRLTIAFALVFLVAPPSHGEQIDSAREAHCIENSSRYNQIPALLLRSIRLQEGGRVGGWSFNLDGSIDYGVMQINSRWLPLLERRGYSAAVLTYDGCACIAAGAWILAQALERYGVWNRSNIDGRVYWRAIGDYHSHTPSLNRDYAQQIWARYQRLVAAGREQ